MADTQPQQTLREILATNGDLRRKVQRAAFLASYDVIKTEGYSITPQDLEDFKADSTALSIAVDSVIDSGSRDIGDDAIKVGIGVAIASGGF